MKLDYTLFDTLLEPVFILKEDQGVVYCNEAAAIVAGLSIRKITRGMKFLDLFEFSEPIEALNNLPSVNDPTPYKEVSFKSSQSSEGKVQITLQPIESTRGEKNWIIFVRDVTLEERLQKKYRAELEQKEDVIKALEDAKLKLEDYSKNLEQMVAARTRELSRLNATMSALLDSLGQGFFIFAEDGHILDVSSKACESTVECKPDGRSIWEVLRLPENKVEGFKKWMQTLFMEMLPFEDLAPLGPSHFSHSQNRHISLEYHPLRSDDGRMEGIVVVASDITSLVEAQRQAEVEKEHAKLILNLVQKKREISRFIEEGQGLLSAIRHDMAHATEIRDPESLFRSLHTLKGGAALFSIQEVAEACHVAETLLSEFKVDRSPTVLESLHKKCLEIGTHFEKFLAETRNVLGTSALSTERQVEIPVSYLNSLARRLRSVPGGEFIAEDLLAKWTMEPAARFLQPYDEVMRQLAERIEKCIAPLEINAQDILIVPEVYNSLFSTLVHAFRNAVDHGIETPEIRLQKGKSEEGHVKVNVSLDSSTPQALLKIKIQDDGGGIDPERIRTKLLERGPLSPSESDEQVIQHIFDSQFSTREQVTDISGRGVGMDAIKFAAEALHGRVWVQSVVGQGTTLHIEVPYYQEPPSTQIIKTSAA